MNTTGTLPDTNFNPSYLQHSINNNNNNNINSQQSNLISDKKLSELRAVALEYVKQIVAKASELSQERQKVKDAQKLTNFYNGTTTNCCKTTNTNSTNQAATTNTTITSTKRLPETTIDPASQRAILREAASIINRKFHLVETTTNKANDKRSEAGLFAFCNQSSTANPEPGNQRTTKTTLVSRSDNGADVVVDQLSNNTGTSSRRTSASGSASNSRRRRRLHHRLNWHLLVSCFSTCLPTSLVEAASRSATSASGHSMDGNGAQHGARI